MTPIVDLGNIGPINEAGVQRELCKRVVFAGLQGFVAVNFSVRKADSVQGQQIANDVCGCRTVLSAD